MKFPYVIGVAGGSGSGKTYFARELQRRLGEENCSILYQDNYYIDQSHRFDVDGGAVNFDHPESLDFDLLSRDLMKLKNNEIVQVPIYDFASHKRIQETLEFKAKKIVIVDGILILDSRPVRAVLDESVFFDTPEELRYARRLERDVKERGRTPEGVLAQFKNQVAPMHALFVEPSKEYATTIIKDDGDYQEAIEKYLKKLNII